jgi:hypothetical protein
MQGTSEAASILGSLKAHFYSKSNPITGLDRPRGFQEVEAPIFQDNRHIKVVRLSALCNSCLYPQEILLVLNSVKRTSQPQGHRVAGRIISMKNFNTIGNWTRDQPTCSTVPQPTAPLRTAQCYSGYRKSMFLFWPLTLYYDRPVWQPSWEIGSLILFRTR